MVKSVSSKSRSLKADNLTVSHPLLRAAGLKSGLLAVMSDDVRLPDPARLADGLPAGTVFILRHYQAPDRLQTALALRQATRANRQWMLVADDFRLAAKVRADGLHLSGTGLQAGAHFGAVAKARGWLVSAACHTPSQMQRASTLGADIVLLSPVFTTRSHPGQRCLGQHGWVRLASSVGSLNCKIALGGVGTGSAKKLKNTGLTGIAAIEGLISG